VCRAELPVRARKGTRFCSTRCRVRAHRARVPTELRSIDRWVTHSPQKVPLTPDDRLASSTDPATWSPYAAVRRLDRRGFVLAGDGIVCLDLDHCLVGGALTEQAAQIVARCPDTYIEVSPSGDGLHIWGRGNVRRGRKVAGVEVYGTGRYITVTGIRFAKSRPVLGDLSDLIVWLLA